MGYARPADSAAPANVLSSAEPPWLARHASDPAYEWARIAWRRALAVKASWFDAAKADKVVQNWPRWFTLTEDRFAGVPFVLTEWQEIIVRLLVGWKVPTEVTDPLTGRETVAHVRLFRRLLLWIPRKNGKSEFLSALSLLFFAIEGTHSGQGFVFARDENQAKIIFEKMKAMVANTPSLAREVKPFQKRLYIPSRKARFELLPGKPEGKHGRSATVITGDEMHEWRSLEIVTVLRQSTGARLQPIELYASTAGPKTNPTGMALWEESQKILDGRIDDPTTLVVIFAANDNDDWLSEDVWRRSNPSLGRSPTLAFLRREVAIAKGNPRAEAHFRCYHLNQWIEAHTRWLNIKKWDACAPDRHAWRDRAESLRGRPCYGGFDISSTRDITALLWLFSPDADGGAWIALPRFWVPEDTLAERVRDDEVAYDKWLAAQALETTPGDFVDQNFVKKAILEGCEMFDVQRIGYDPWNATKLVSDLQNDGVPADMLLKVRQGVQSLGEPTKRLETLVYAGQFDHGGHPVLRWMAGNAVVRFDENLNYMPAKKRSAEKIDGIAAAVNAMAAAAPTDDGMIVTGNAALAV